MPLASTFSSLSKNGYSATTDGNYSGLWLSAQSLKNGYTSVSYPYGFNGNVKITNNAVCVYGTGSAYDGSVSTYRVSAMYINNASGRVSRFLELGDFSFNSINTPPLDVVRDSAGNTHMLFGPTNTQTASIASFSVNGVLNQAITFPGSLGFTFRGLAVDSSNNLYLLSNDSNVRVTKIDSSYNIVWNKYINVSGAGVNDGWISVDNAGSIVVSLSLGTFGINLIKLDNTGSILWQKSYNAGTGNVPSGNKLVIDSSNNIYLTTYSGTTSSIFAADSATGALATSVVDFVGAVGGSVPFIALNSAGQLVTSVDSGQYVYILNRTTFASVSSFRVYLSSITNSTTLTSLNSIASIAGKTYYNYGLQATNTRTYRCNALIALDNTPNIVSTPFNFTIVDEASVNEIFHGTLNTASASAPTITSSSATVATTSFTVTSPAISTSSTTYSLGTVVPYNYIVPLT